jgi:hypothetical protein
VPPSRRKVRPNHRPRTTDHARPIRYLLPIPILLLATGCGYVGPVQPPSLNTPETVTDLIVVERGDKLAARFTISSLTTDGLALRKFGAVDLRVGPVTEPGFNVDQWATGAKSAEGVAAKPGVAHAQIPAGPWIGQEIAAAVRISNSRGRYSDWSNIVRLRLAPPLAPPADFRAGQIRQEVKLTWRAQPGEGIGYRIYRRQENEPSETVVATVQTNEWVDPETKYGGHYWYAIQAFEKAGQIDAESEISTPLEIAPRSSVPPAVPAGVGVIAGSGSIELQWSRNTESDLSVYRVYRSVSGGAWEKIAEVDVPAYSDRAIKAGERYQYAITAVDQAGNESARSAAVEITAP